MPEAWQDLPQAPQESSFANLPWWELLGDTTLQGVVRQGLRHNRDLRIALARVNESRAIAGIQRLESLPEINVNLGGGTRQIGDSIANLSGEREGRYDYFRADVDVRWELDLWGRLRRLNESAQAQLLAQEYGRRAAIVTLVSEIAVTYLELKDLDTQVAIADTTVATQRRSLTLARARFEGALTSELDVRQGEAALARAESELGRLQREARQRENQLNVLVGQIPGPIARGASRPEASLRSAAPAGLPSALLERRPDVREAEERLRAANARIGAAIAARFPTISLTGAAGSISDDVEDLLQSGTGFWRLATGILAPVLNAGRSGRQVELERARTEAAVALYEKTVLEAFREVEDALIGVETFGRQVEAASRRVESARRATDIADHRYRGGLDSFFTVLAAQRALFDAQLEYSALQRREGVAMIQLYKSLGGGWDPVTDTLALPTSVGAN